MKQLTDYINPAEAVEEFEKALADYVNVNSEKHPIGVVCVDSIAHAIELGIRFKKPNMYATIPENVPVDTAMNLAALGIDYMATTDEDAKWEHEYRIEGTIVYDSRDWLAEDMFGELHKHKMVCISFDTTVGGGAAIITNSKEAYEWLKLAANGGADPVSPDEVQEYSIGYQYQMRPSDAIAGMEKLETGGLNVDNGHHYSSVRNITINK